MVHAEAAGRTGYENPRAEAAPAAPRADGPYHISGDGEQGLSLAGICPFRHNYDSHPLMQLERLGKLAEALMETKQCRFILPGTTDASRFDHQPESADGRSVREAFARMEEPGSWVALYNVQTDPEYGKFLWDVMASAGKLVEKQENVYDVRGFIFISAPPSVTPFHIDRENNFWMQIRGRKTISVWDRMDRSVVSARDVEEFIHCGALENVKLTDESRKRANEFNCGPGDGVYFPSTSPHMTRTETSWVKPGDGVVISIGIVFYTDVTRRNAYVHGANAVLRRLGFKPPVAAMSAWRDRLKYPLGRAVVFLRQKIQGYTPPPGF